MLVRQQGKCKQVNRWCDTLLRHVFCLQMSLTLMNLFRKVFAPARCLHAEIAAAHWLQVMRNLQFPCSSWLLSSC